MPTDSYTFRVTLSGADAIKEAQRIRASIHKELSQVTLLELGNLPEAKQQLEQLRLTARGVGKAMTSGFRTATKRLVADITSLQEQVNAVVRGGAGPVEQALDNLGVMGLDALDMVDAGSTKATQKMARLTNTIRGAQTEIEALQQRIAQLGAQPLIPAGSLSGEVRTVSELFKELTGYRMGQVRRLFRDMQKDLEPVTAELEKQAEAARAEARPAYEKIKAEVEELQAALSQLVVEQNKVNRASEEYRNLGNEIKMYRQAIFEAEEELSQLRSILMGGGMDEATTKLRYQQEQYLRALEETTPWWKELTRGAGEHADVIEQVTKRDREAGAALAEMIASWERIRKLQTSISRGIGTMQRMGDRVELPPGTEGTLATLVVAERALGESTKLSADEFSRQRKELNKLMKIYDQAAQAAAGLDRTQRDALKRIQMVARKQMTGATKISKGLTVEEAGLALQPILAQVSAQTEAIKNRTLASLEEMEEEGKQRRPFAFLIRAAEKARSLIVGESIIPEMVVAINQWLSKVGVDDPFTQLAMDANQAAELIHTGLEQRLKTLSTDKAQAELEELQQELKETGHAIESQLVVTSQASQAYKRAFADYAAEVRRVRGDDPTAMALLAQGKALKGTGIRGEFKEIEIIDQGYQAISTEVQERRRLSEQEMQQLAALEARYTALRQAALALERELQQRKVASLEKSMAAALDEEQDITHYEQLNQQYTIAQDRLGEISEEIAFEREMITSKAVAAAKEELTQAKALARRTIPTGAVGKEVAGEVVMPHITQTQVKNAAAYAGAIREVGKALTETKGTLPLVTQAEQERLVATTKAMTEAEESERRLTAAKRSELRLQELDKEREAQVEVELTRQAAQAQAEHQKRITAIAKAAAQERTAIEKQEARAQATTAIEEERRHTAQLKEEERRRTLDHQDEIRKRQQADRKMRQAQMQPTAAELTRYGGGALGAMSWAVQEAQMQQMGLRMLAYDIQYASRQAMMMSAALVGPPVLSMRRFVEYTRETDHAARAMGLAREESEYLRHELIEQSQALAMAKPEEMARGLYMWATGVGATARNEAELRKVIEDTIPIQEMAYMQRIDLAQATENVAGIEAEFRMETAETQRVVEVLTATADRTFAAVGDLGEAFKFVGPVAHDLGISMEDVASTMGLLADANIRGSMAGRAMRQLLIRLTKTTKEEDDALNKLLRRNTALGESWRDIVFPEGKFIGLAKWIDLVAAATANLTEEERGAVLSTISTANELPALTALITRQIEAREHGINIIRAESKILQGTIDDEVAAYTRWEEETTGNIMSMESAHEGFERKVTEMMESESYQIDQMQRRWDAAMLALGEHTMKTALPALEDLAAIMEELAETITEHPEIAQAMLAAGVAIGAIGVIGTTATNLLRIMTLMRTVATMMKGWQAARALETAAAGTQAAAAGTQEVAAGTQVAAAETQQAAATMQASTGRGLGKSILSLVAVVASIAGGFEVGLGITNLVRGGRGQEAYGQGEALGKIWDFVRQSAALTAGTGGALTALLLGEDPGEAFDIATYEAGRLLGLIEEEAKPAAEKTGEELRDWNVELERARRNVKGVGSELMQLPAATEAGLAQFTEAELEAIDELESYLRRRGELIEEHNDELAKMEREFQEEERERYRDYLAERADLLEDLQQVTQDPLWRATEEYEKSRKRQAKGYEDYQERIAKIEADYLKRLRNLREDHEDKMEGLEASRDARGILAERRRYRRAVRDAKERRDSEIDSAKERWEEIVETEREKLAEMREERRRDLEEKLRELDENYQEEAQKRQLEFQKKYQEKQLQNQKELQQLEQAHAERLARIMGWEQRVRDALRRSYLDREGDLRDHLARMERMYLETYQMLSELSPEAMTEEEYRQWHEEIRGHQFGGYAGRGIYRLGEAGREYVLSSTTTRALERAIGPLNQARVLSMATGRSGGYYQLDINVRADEHFSPDFAAQTEAMVQQAIVNLATGVAKSKPSAHRLPF